MMFRTLLLAPGADTVDPDALARVVDAFGVLIRGMCTVFAVLCIIWLALVIVRLFMYDLPLRKKTADIAAHADEDTLPAEPRPDADDSVLIAVLAAAVAAARSDEGESGSFRVVSFHRKNK